MPCRWSAALTTLLALASIATAAGDVSVEVDSHRTVRLTGDVQANSVEVVPGEVADSWNITGLDGTTIDGQPQRVVLNAKGLRADLGAGDDRIEVRRITCDRDLRVKGEDGDDVTIWRSLVVRRRTAWTGGDGADRLDIDGSCVFRRSLNVRGKQGRDVVTIKDSRALGPTRIRGNRGADDVILRRMSFTSNARLRIVTGSGEDVVTLDTCKLDRHVYLGTGRSDDYVTIVDSHANSDFHAGLGRSDDRLNVDDSSFDKDVKLDGDSGRDTLDFDGDVRFRGAEKRPDKYEIRLRDFEHRR